jgi:hypothetical protein
MIVVEATWSLAPSFFWIHGIWGSLLCSGWYHCHGTCSMKSWMCMGLSHDHILVLACPLSGCTSLTYDRTSLGSFLVRVDQNSFLSFLEARSHQN